MYYDPFEEMQRLHEEMDRLFAHWMGASAPLLGYSGEARLPAKAGAARSPVCHLQETESSLVAAFELPGVEKEDIELTVDDDRISLKVESRSEKKHEGKERSSYSVASRSFYRAMPLPRPVDSSKATASYKDGVLRVEMPKREEAARSRRLQIK